MTRRAVSVLSIVAIALLAAPLAARADLLTVNGDFTNGPAAPLRCAAYVSRAVVEASAGRS